MELSWCYWQSMRRAIPILWVVSPFALFAQGNFTPTVLFTGGGPPLITESRTFQTLSNAGALRLSLEVGFSTEEMLQPGSFADSFSLTLRPASSSLSPILFFTMDAGGVVWAPPTPGTLLIDPASILRTSISFPALNPDLPNRISFHVDAPIPDAYRGESLTLHFDLFDNANASRSLGWFSEPAIVPEPSVVTLFLMAALLGWCARRFRQ
jgi:hypothetical protein